MGSLNHQSVGGVREGIESQESKHLMATLLKKRGFKVDTPKCVLAAQNKCSVVCTRLQHTSTV